jgi:hypothetical protein
MLFHDFDIYEENLEKYSCEEKGKEWCVSNHMSCIIYEFIGDLSQANTTVVFAPDLFWKAISSRN